MPRIRAFELSPQAPVPPAAAIGGSVLVERRAPKARGTGRGAGTPRQVEARPWVAAPARETHARSWSLPRDLPDLFSRVVVAGLFLALAYRLALNFLLTGRVTGLLLLASELLVAVLMIIRRPASSVDRTWTVRVVTALSIAGPLLVRPITAAGRVEDIYTAALSACGLLVTVAGKLSLGRSFGLVPANRGIVCSGPYRIVRHPIYAGYLVTHAAFAAAHFTLWNAVVLGASDAALLLRASYEERVLSRDEQYARYRARVRWRVAPGVF